jgi:DNA-binding NtrC family response regulator
MDGLALLEHLGVQHPQLPVIIMTAHSDLDSAVSAYRGGAFEYLPVTRPATCIQTPDRPVAKATCTTAAPAGR